ncbi:hypothetical protein DFH08DRAFT_719671 [Mycena albidolilacea]|uniref:BTB domain-containing protein n=1 Tax=Mycena albidolilacea TaxID=1033008 RepID=A0AAD7EBR3_9AGAR|nr:hypothetical protein DFH08DRAFT_719671 [Mycena albidolilacea]
MPARFKDASAPFSGATYTDNSTILGLDFPSDFILRSSDGVDFHLHKAFLRFVSGCFEGMFTFPGGDEDPSALVRDGKPVVVLPEPESVLYKLLSLAYPAQSPELYTLTEADLDRAVALHEAAHKYQFIHVQRLFERMLQNSALLDAHPYRLYAIARLCDIPALTTKATLSTLKSDGRPARPKFPELKLITWEDGNKLQAFHRSCGEEAKKIVEETASVSRLEDRGMKAGTRDANGHIVAIGFQFFVWWAAKEHGSECGPKTQNGGQIIGPTSWFATYITRLAQQLYLVPSRSTVETEALTLAPAEHAIIDKCPACAKRAERDLWIFAHQLANQIDTSNHNLGQ